MAHRRVATTGVTKGNAVDLYHRGNFRGAIACGLRIADRLRYVRHHGVGKDLCAKDCPSIDISRGGADDHNVWLEVVGQNTG